MSVSVKLKTLFALVLLAAAGNIAAGTRTWKSNTTGYWSTPANWEEGVVPVAGDDVVVTAPGAHAVLESSSADLSSLTLSGTLTFTNWPTALRAENVTILQDGVMTLPPAFDAGAMSNRVHVICHDMIVESGGRIDVDARGHFSATGPGAPTISAAGAAHGGFGGMGNSVVPYGDPAAPMLPGSGGGTGTTDGHGGGSVFIEATGVVVVNGRIAANGGLGAAAYPGGGSGGSVYIVCNTIHGTGGVVEARGGATKHRGSGGGGRIAVAYNPVAQQTKPIPDVLFSVHGGSDRIWWRITGNERPGGLGTLYFPDAGLLTTNIRHDGRIIIPGFTNWSAPSLMVSNAWVSFPIEGFKLDIEGDVILTDDARLELGDSEMTWVVNGFRFHNETSSPVLKTGGTLILTNTSIFQIYAAATNQAWPGYGALVDVVGDVMVSEKSWIYPYSHLTNSGSVLFRSGNFKILSTNSGINANAIGFRGGYGPGQARQSAGGGGYGGEGGYPDRGGLPYGSSNAPVEPGSGGGITGSAGGEGGGSVRIETREAMILNGIIKANGQIERTTYHGSGSGGGVYIRCRTFSGTAGVVEADGAYCQYRGAGGGGRIAVWREYDDSTGINASAYGGDGNNYPGHPGTIVFGTFPSIRAGITNFSMVVQSNRTESMSFEIWNAASGGDPAYYSFDFSDVPTLEFSPSSGALSPLQTNVIYMTCVAGSSQAGIYNGTLSVLATNQTMIGMAPYAVDVAAEIEVVPPPRGTLLMTR